MRKRWPRSATVTGWTLAAVESPRRKTDPRRCLGDFFHSAVAFTLFYYYQLNARALQRGIIFQWFNNNHEVLLLFLSFIHCLNVSTYLIQTYHLCQWRIRLTISLSPPHFKHTQYFSWIFVSYNLLLSLGIQSNHIPVLPKVHMHYICHHNGGK